MCESAVVTLVSLDMSRYRKPAVDWRRQQVRGTLHVGRFYEGPPTPGATTPSDYTPGIGYAVGKNIFFRKYRFYITILTFALAVSWLRIPPHLGNTFNRLDNVHAPFSDAEWQERKKYRSWDMGIKVWADAVWIDAV